MEQAQCAVVFVLRTIMSKLINIVGEKFGRLTVVGYSHKGSNRHSYWKCLCDCGKEVVVGGPGLKGGGSQSCGCLHKERASAANKTHGKTGTAIHRVWKNMVQRCTNPKNPRWADYGGRGITVCEEWQHDFHAFYSHMGDIPDEGYTIDRVDNGLGYCPGNVKWSNQLQQISNRRNSVMVNHNGGPRYLMELCKEHDVNYFLAYNRIVRNGQSSEEAIEELICSKEPSIAQGLEEEIKSP